MRSNRRRIIARSCARQVSAPLKTRPLRPIGRTVVFWNRSRRKERMNRTRRQAMGVLFGGAAMSLAPVRAHAALEPIAPLAPEAAPSRIRTGHDAFQHLTAPVMLNGKGPYPFLVDTGANISCVARGLAEALALPMRAPTTM